MMVVDRSFMRYALVFFLTLALSATPAVAENEPPAATPDPDVAWARVEQQVLPSFEARRLAAEARRTAAEAYFAGEKDLDEAFPRLAEMPLRSPAWLHGRLAELDREVMARERERQEPLAELDSEEHNAIYRTARAAAFDAEDAADGLERRLLLAVRGHLEAHPELTALALEPLFDRLEERSRQAQRAFEAAEDKTTEAAEDAAAERVAVESERQLLEEILGGLLRAATVPGVEADAVDLHWLETRREEVEGENREEAHVEAQLATERAEEARRASETVSSGAAEIQERYAETEDQSGSRWRDYEARTTELEARRHDQQKRLESARAEFTAIEEELKSVDMIAERERRADELYGDLRALIAELRRHAIDAGPEIEARDRLRRALHDASEKRREIERWRERAAKDQLEVGPELFGRWERALERGLEALELWAELELDQRQSALLDLGQAKALRRELEDEISARARAQERGYFLDDLLAEARLLGPNFKALLDHRLAALGALPGRVGDLQLLSTAVFKALWCVFVLVVAALLWRQGKPLARWLASKTSFREFWRSEALWNIDELSQQVASVLASTLGLATAVTLFAILRHLGPELDLLLLLVLLLALYRWISSLAALPWPIEDDRGQDLLRQSAKVLSFWFFSYYFLRYLALDILHAMTLATLVGWVFASLFAAIAIWLLWRWEPVLRGPLKRQFAKSLSERFPWLFNDSPSWWLRPLRALAGTLLLTIGGIWHLFRGEKGEESPFHRLLASVGLLKSGARAHPEEEGGAAQLPQKIFAHLLYGGFRPDLYVGRPQTDEGLDAIYGAWRRVESRRGLVALIGDQGLGAGTYLDHWCQRREAAPEAGGGEISRIALGDPLYSREDGLAWLVEELELELGESGADGGELELEKVIAALEKTCAQRIVVVEHFDRAFLRTVGGFEALRALCYVFHASSRRIFWLVSVRLPAWAYLSSLRGLVRVDVFEPVFLERFDEEMLKELLENRLGAAGYRLSFDRLLEGEAGGGDLEIAERRFYYHLCRTAQGNPGVALQLLRELLVPREGEGEMLDALPRRALFESTLPAVDDEELFILAALRTQRGLTEKNLVKVMNAEHAEHMPVRDAVKKLELSRIIRERDKRYQIESRYLAAVTEKLRAKELITWTRAKLAGG